MKKSLHKLGILRGSFILILFLVVLPFIPLLIEVFIYGPITNFKHEMRLKHALNQERWITYEDKELGLSFEYPESWKVHSYQPGEFYDEHHLSIHDGGITFISIFKKSSGDFPRTIDENRLIRESRLINGDVFIVFHPEVNRENRKAGKYMISEKKDLMVEIIPGDTDSSSGVRLAEDNVLYRITNSFKSI